MRLEPVSSDEPRVVLRALRGAVLGAGPAVALGAPAGLPRDVPPGTAVVLTTSGSTGVPKSVALSRAALTSSALATARRIGEGQWLLPLAGGYIAGVQVMVRALVAGRDPAILAGRFTADAFVHAASGMRSFEGGARVPTFTSLVPAQLLTLVDAAERDPRAAAALAGFEAILVGGQRLPDALRDRALALGARVVRTYGSTETSGGCVYDGVPLDGVRAADVGGELRIAGPTLADGYLGDPERTAAAFVTDPSGVRWYRTGDAGVFSGGVVTVTGRIDNVIVSGGVNVSLDRVEHAVREVPGLSAAVVVGALHPRWGATPVVVVEGAAPDGALAAARDAAERAIGKPARPDRVVTVAAMPRLASGKPDRRALTDMLAA
ncbi:AMP-binding protein [Microbacterium sp. ZXX196]|uniref:AMP-binding protein n=1 Tax=Microbacterium sp. ZXX196 TaxID=2609291 RepID=UPI0012B83AA4|nr:AMP-binding protein [Microbacterium sp. ZXX196]MTE23328.1 AMP-binding protein [Microbacterium sp. ZXX196]